MRYDPKDPDDIDDFTLDWANLLSTGETIATFAAAVTSGTAAVSSSGTSGTLTTARITGGTEGEDTAVRYRITTSTGRQLDMTIRFAIVTQ